mmetsp:Transcript_104660/g.239935  ORF Transcript_104660/g.239935 Transcript_104660/m.239935 type:complete len:671 (+) Transcript_104660:25-2037(+)
MSHKQAAKLRALLVASRQSVPACSGGDDKDVSSESDVGTALSVVQRPGFAALDSESPSSSSECEVEPVRSSARPKIRAAPGDHASPKPPQQRAAARRRRQTSGIGGTDQASDEDGWLDVSDGQRSPQTAGPQPVRYCLAMDVLHFDTDNERQRTVSRTSYRARNARPKNFVHKSRRWLVTGGDDWPVLRDSLKMKGVASDGLRQTFEVHPTADYKAVTSRFTEVVGSSNFALLAEFSRRNPFHVETLLHLADIHMANGDMDMVFELARKAVYAVQCSFCPQFSPSHLQDIAGVLVPSVMLPLHAFDSAQDHNVSCIKALYVYMVCLYRRGFPRTALEICKLLLCTAAPEDPLHVLLAIDLYALQSQQYQALYDISSQYVCQTAVLVVGDCGASSSISLSECLPNFAFSVAFARFTESKPSLQTVGDVCAADVASCTVAMHGLPAVSAHASLIRALLLFPSVLRPLLQRLGLALDQTAPGSPCLGVTWGTLLQHPPFSDGPTAFVRAEATILNRCSDAYAFQAIDVWKDDEALRWLHVSACRLRDLCSSESESSAIKDVRRQWQQVPIPTWLLEQYKDVVADEFCSRAPVFPEPIQPIVPVARAAQNEREPTVSIHSHPLIAFWQSFMPWAVVDKSGLRVPATLLRDLIPTLHNVSRAWHAVLRAVREMEQ